MACVVEHVACGMCGGACGMCGGACGMWHVACVVEHVACVVEHVAVTRDGHLLSGACGSYKPLAFCAVIYHFGMCWL